MCFFFFFNDTATTEIYTLSLHDALPIWFQLVAGARPHGLAARRERRPARRPESGRDDRHPHPAVEALVEDRKSTRLNSSHAHISYAVFCFKKKKNNYINPCSNIQIEHTI